MDLLVDGAWRFLSRGEGLRFHANQPHGYRNLESKAATIHDMPLF